MSALHETIPSEWTAQVRTMAQRAVEMLVGVWEGFRRQHLPLLDAPERLGARIQSLAPRLVGELPAELERISREILNLATATRAMGVPFADHARLA